MQSRSAGQVRVHDNDGSRMRVLVSGVLIAITLFAASVHTGRSEQSSGRFALQSTSADSGNINPTAQVIPAGVRRINAYTGQNRGTDWVDADVAVVDTGVDPTHPDLNVVGGVDCTGAGDWTDGFGHGTHVAGTIGALDNDFGVVGVAPGARIWSVKVMDENGYSTPEWILCGVNWLVAHPDIEVANFSMSFPTCRFPSGMYPGEEIYTERMKKQYESCMTTMQEVYPVLDYLQDHHMVIVFAAGNDGSSADYEHPWLAIPGILGVGAFSDFDGSPGGAGLTPDEPCAGPFGWFGTGTVEQDDTVATFSDFGRFVDIYAPGVCVLSTAPGGNYAYHSGTSMAAPHVSGLAALWKVAHPNGYGWQFEIDIRTRATEEFVPGREQFAPVATR